MAARQRRHSTTTDVLTNAVKNIEKKIETALTVLWEDLPSWQQDNQFIQSGYRPASNSFKKSFHSLGYLHNESVNIYTHLLGAVMFTVIGVLLYIVLAPRYESASTSDVLAFSCFFLGAALCLGMSATFHAISNHSPLICKFGNKLDYIGIVCLITGSFIPSVYYGLYCHPHLVEAYWTMICSIGVGCISVSIFEKFRTPEWRPYRAGLFVAMGLSSVFPVIHGIELYGVANLQDRIGLTYLTLQGLLYLIGAGIYASRFPECMWPGSFDIWGSSHQIFHVLVVLAAASHLKGLLIAFDYHHNGLEFKGC